MVVLLIIAILLAIAIPTFLGVANSAGDRAAQSNLTNALTEAKALYQNSATYSPGCRAITAATFSASAPEFSWVSGCLLGDQRQLHQRAVVDAGQRRRWPGHHPGGVQHQDTTCWYAVDLESTPPVALVSVTPGRRSSRPPRADKLGGCPGLLACSTPSTGSTLANCTAAHAATTTGFAWGLSYCQPGAGA